MNSRCLGRWFCVELVHGQPCCQWDFAQPNAVTRRLERVQLEATALT